MDNIKISASFTIPGSVMYTEKDSQGEPVHYKNVSFNVSNKRGKQELLKMKLSKCKPCKQVINMTEDAYNSMLNIPPKNTSPVFWKRLPVTQRISEHLKDIQLTLHATDFEFTIFND